MKGGRASPSTAFGFFVESSGVVAYRVAAMPRHLSPSLLLVLVAGCSDGGLDFGRSAAELLLGTLPVSSATTSFSVTVLPSRADVCQSHRWVGLEATCTATVSTHTGGSWVRQPLFGAPAGTPLRDYCTWEWVDADPGRPVPPVSGVVPQLYERDCDVVGGLSPSNRRSGAVLADHFVKMVAGLRSATSSASLPNDLGGANRLWMEHSVEPARVAVVDSAVSSDHSFTGRLEHGRAMYLLMKQLACVGDFCPLEALSRLALPRFRHPVSGATVFDPIGGGYFGAQSDLAAAIYEAVEALDAEPVRSARILNLSVGWAPDWGGSGSPGTLPLSVRAVLDALEYASCRGVLTFSAAGNRSGGQGSAAGAYYPAAWETRQAPSIARCSELGVSVATQAAGSYRPLLYAVAGVDGRDQQLANAAEDSRPSLVAAGMQATVLDPDSRAYTGLYTGSSVSAAAASAIAAMIWSLDPDLGPHEVVEAMRLTSANLPSEAAGDATAQFGLPGAPLVTKRLSVCHAVRRMCNLRGDCRLACWRRDAIGSARGVVAPVATSSVGAFEYEAPTHSVCDDVPVWRSSPAFNGYDPCPDEQYFSPNFLPSVVPQPNFPLCRTCGYFEGSGRAVIDLEPGNYFAIGAATLYFGLEGGGVKTFNFDVDAEAFGAGAIEVEGFALGAAVKSVKLEVPLSTPEGKVGYTAVLDVFDGD